MNSKLFSSALLVFTVPAHAALIASWDQNESSGNLIDSTGGHPAAVPVGTNAYSQPGVPNGTYGSIVVAGATGTSIGYGPSIVDSFFTSGSDNNNPVMNIPNTGSFTVMSWINPTAGDIAGRSYRPLSTGSAGGADRGWGVALRLGNADGTNATIRFTSYGLADNDSDPFTAVIGSWVHIAATYNNGAINYYLNGNLLTGGDTSVFGDEGVAARLTIGGRLGGNDADQVSGRLDGVRVYNEVLTAAQIQAAALASVSAVPEPSSLALAAAAATGLLRRRRKQR
ncbi:MAG TPA: LamG domain-containing protein [Verrucomicrobiales bacterium]|nr:LamG domain-containing protein [Verrucomicrobiales bacterium]